VTSLVTRRWRAARGLVAALAVLALTACGSALGQSGDEELLVAAAADLRPAFDRLAASFEAETGQAVTVVYGSSGQLAQQLIEGAPADLYASANVRYVEEVLAAGRGDASTTATYAFGRIALWAPAEAWGGWTDLAALAGDPAVDTIAIANPSHAPYGAAAREAREAAGVGGAGADRLVLGEHIADTHRLAASGNADAAITALSLALAADDGEWLLLPEELHDPLEQALVIVADDRERAELAARFVAHVNSGREVMRRYGFLLPGEAPPEDR
jgi:molybdate transport system substrate-binding protein